MLDGTVGVTDGGTVSGDGPPKIIKRIGAILGLTGFLIVLFYVSLLETSEPVTFEQKQVIHRAIDVIESRGSGRDAFLLRRLANYRTTDNWWNRYVGHADAYAATNFPFWVVTLYPDFFTVPADHVERASILLHEARHLSGDGEEAAFSGVWRDRAKLGWTKDKYDTTRVWQNVGEFTQKYAPHLFRCGAEGRSDCVGEAGP
ncbi:MAG: hypothetical protein ACRD68_13795 [Pyrinomonadaceae bacterium]